MQRRTGRVIVIWEHSFVVTKGQGGNMDVYAGILVDIVVEVSASFLFSVK